MQNYTEISLDEGLSDSLAMILDNDKTALSCSSGTAFPTANVQIGQLCFRTDENKLYQTKDGKAWVEVGDLSKSFTAHKDELTAQGIQKSMLNKFGILREGFERFEQHGASVVGTLAIRMPLRRSITMMNMKVRGMHYATGKTVWELDLGAYAYSTGWVNTVANSTSDLPWGNSVRFAEDDTYAYILLGTTATAWSYPRIWIEEVMVSISPTPAQLDPSNYTLMLLTDESALTVQANTAVTAKATQVEDGVYASTAQTISGAKTFSGVTKVTNATDSSSTASGGLVVSGGLGVAKQLRVGGTTTLGGALNVSGTTAFTGTTTHNGGIIATTGKFNDVTDSTSTTTGALQTLGGLGVDRNANIGGSASVGGTLNVKGKVTAGSVDSTGAIKVADTTDSSSQTTGALIVSGGAGFGGKVYAPTFVGALTGNASTATKLQTARTINGVSFDGSSNITVADSTKLPLAGGTVTGALTVNGLITAGSNGIKTPKIDSASAVSFLNNSAAQSVYTGGVLVSSAYADSTKIPTNGIYSKGKIHTATSVEVGSSVDGVKDTDYIRATIHPPTHTGGDWEHTVRDDATYAYYKLKYGTSGHLQLRSDGTLSASGGFDGNASTATKLATARTINGVSFDGSGNVVIGEPTFATPLMSYASGDANALNTGGFNVRYLNQSAANKPTGTDHGVMTLNYSAIWSGQQAFDWRTGDVFTRTQSNGTWLDWATQVDTRNYAKTIPTFSVNGVGLVPARVGSTTTKFLREDGTWVIPTDTTYAAMTEANAITGTETTARLITAAVLKRAIQTHAPTPTTITGNAGTATKLATARTINGVAFDGSANITVADSTKLPTAGGTITGALAVSGLLTANGGFKGHYVTTDNRALTPSATPKGAFGAYFTSQGGLTGAGNATYGDLLTLNSYHDTSGGNANALFFAKGSKSIFHYQAAQGATTWGAASQLAYVTDNVASATRLATARTIGGVSFDGAANINLPGVNATGNQNTTGSAATLTTARTINGTSFNGSANITTANWGTARTITIGSTGKSVNGSANVAWTLAEIGAAAASHTHAYLSTAGGTLSGNLSVTGSITATGNVTAYSDKRIKKNIKNIGDALAKVNQLNGVTFDRKDTGESQTGLLAQEVEAVLPQAVSRCAPSAKAKKFTKGEDILAVNYGSLVGLLVESIKEIDEKLKAQQELIDKQAKLIENLLAKSKS